LSRIDSSSPSKPVATWIGLTLDQLAGGGQMFASPTSTLSTLMPLDAAAK
jgi:hypothetical protein